MELASISPESVLAMSAQLTASAYGYGVARKVLDQAQTEGADLAKLIDSAGGVGGHVDTYA